MLMLISPAKSLDMDTPVPLATYSMPQLLSQTECLVDVLRDYSEDQIAQLMSISGKLARLNAQRYQDFSLPFSSTNAKQCLFAFDGDVYEGLSALTLSHDAIVYLQEHLRILSGLYGVLKPLDLMQPYRLEMGTKLPTVRGRDLYDFWGDIITQELVRDMSVDDVLVNLASEEYFSSVKPKLLAKRIVTPVFQDEKSGRYKIVSFYAKKARGLMVRFAAQQQITSVEDLKSFTLAGYAYAPEVSTDDKWVFRRAEGVVS